MERLIAYVWMKYTKKGMGHVAVISMLECT